MYVRRLPAALLGLAALALAACQPIPSGAPPPAAGPAEAAPPACAEVAAPTPTPEAPVDYVAAVEPAGPDDFAVETFSAGTLAECDDSVAGLDANGTVLALEPIRIVEALDVDPLNDTPYYAQQYGLHADHADFETAWAAGYDGTGVTIAVVDTGVQATHRDLTFYDPHRHFAPKVDFVNGRDFLNLAPGSGNGTPDPNSHGTHVSGIAAAADNVEGGIGGAPGATILPVRVLGASGSGFNSDVAKGIDWARTHGADVINLSLGGPLPDTVLAAAVQSATAAGIVVAVAAGNCGAGGGSCTSVNAPNYPAAGPDADVIAVGATNSSDERAGYSNSNSYVDLAAPGDQIISTIPTSSYATKNGTSMATPHVAAAAALLIQKCPGITPAEVEQILIDSGTDPVTGFLADVRFIQMGAAVALPCPS